MMTPKEIAKTIINDSILNESDLYGIRVKPTNNDSLRIDKLINLVQSYFVEWDVSNPRFQKLALNYYPKEEWDNYQDLATLLWFELNRSEQDQELIKKLKKRLIKPKPLNLFVFSDDHYGPATMTGIAGALKTARDSAWATIYLSTNLQPDDFAGRLSFDQGVLSDVDFDDRLIDHEKFNKIPEVRELSLKNRADLNAMANMLKYVIKHGVTRDYKYG